MRKQIIWLLSIGLILGTASMAGAEMGELSPKSSDIEVNFFGSLKTYPTFIENVNFNSDVKAGDWILDESGALKDHGIRNEIRLGWTGKGENWDFLIILESDFNLDKANGDRGQNATTAAMFNDIGMSGEDFGVEKLNVTYDFGPMAVETGWTTKFLDLMTGGLVYGDDHPYIGLTGQAGERFSWEALYLIIQDDIDIEGNAGSPWDADSLDWRAYTFKGIYKLPNDFVISPFYAFSDNSERDSESADVHYFGAEAYGKLGPLTPRLELVYATGDTNADETGREYDISSWAAYASVDYEVCPGFTPYAGITYMSGDDSDSDSDIEAYNGITDISRYTPTFGIENAIIYRYVPTLGSHLYSHTFDMLAGSGTSPGYGGISNSGQGSSPGLLQYGIGAKGKYKNWFYKTQFMYFFFAEQGALEEIHGKSIDDEVGWEFDLRTGYNFGKHFTLAATVSMFEPGDAIQDIYGEDYDDSAFLNTIELIWNW